ncbi:MAG: hypothetical protein ACOC2F_04455 [Bacteroidota bacterium]
MKKRHLLIPVMALFISCSGGAGEEAGKTDNNAEQSEALQETTRQLEYVIDSSEKEMNTLQNEVDSMLNEI